MSSTGAAAKPRPSRTKKASSPSSTHRGTPHKSPRRFAAAAAEAAAAALAAAEGIANAGHADVPALPSQPQLRNPRQQLTSYPITLAPPELEAFPCIPRPEKLPVLSDFVAHQLQQQEQQPLLTDAACNESFIVFDGDEIVKQQEQDFRPELGRSPEVNARRRLVMVDLPVEKPFTASKQPSRQRDEVSELRRQIEDMRDDGELKDRTIEGLEVEMAQLKLAVAGAEAFAARLDFKLNESCIAGREKDAQYVALEAELANARNLVLDAREAVDRLNAENLELRGQAQRAVELEVIAQHAESEVSRLHAQLAALLVETDRVAGERDLLKEELEEIQRNASQQHVDQQRAVDDFMSGVQQQAKLLADREALMQRLLEEKDRHSLTVSAESRAHISALEAEVGRLGELLEERERELREADAALQHTQATAQRAAADSTDSIQSLTEEVDALRQRAKTTADTILALEDALVIAREEFASMSVVHAEVLALSEQRAQSAELELCQMEDDQLATLDRMRKKEAEASEHIEYLKAALEAQNDRAVQLEYETEHLRAELTRRDCIAQSEQLQSLERLRAQQDVEIQERQELLAQRTEEMMALRVQLGVLRQTNENAIDEIQRLRMQLDDATTATTSLRADAAGRAMELQLLQRHLESKEAALRDTQARYHELAEQLAVSRAEAAARLEAANTERSGVVRAEAEALRRSTQLDHFQDLLATRDVELRQLLAEASDLRQKLQAALEVGSEHRAEAAGKAAEVRLLVAQRDALELELRVVRDQLRQEKEQQLQHRATTETGFVAVQQQAVARQAEVETLRQELQRQSDSILRKDGELDVLRARLHALEREAGALRAQCEHAAATATALNDANSALCAARAESERWRHDADRHSRAIKSLEEQLSSKCRELEEAQTQSHALAESQSMLSAELASCLAQWNEVQVMALDAARRAKAAEKNTGNNEETLAPAPSQEHTEAAVLKDQIVKERAQFAAVESALETAQTQATEFRQGLQQLREERTSLSLRVKDLEQQLQSSETQLLAIGQENAHLLTRLADLERIPSPTASSDAPPAPTKGCELCTVLRTRMVTLEEGLKQLSHVKEQELQSRELEWQQLQEQHDAEALQMKECLAQMGEDLCRALVWKDRFEALSQAQAEAARERERAALADTSASESEQPPQRPLRRLGERAEPRGRAQSLQHTRTQSPPSHLSLIRPLTPSSPESASAAQVRHVVSAPAPPQQAPAPQPAAAPLATAAELVPRGVPSLSRLWSELLASSDSECQSAQSSDSEDAANILRHRKPSCVHWDPQKPPALASNSSTAAAPAAFSAITAAPFVIPKEEDATALWQRLLAEEPAPTFSRVATATAPGPVLGVRL
eukprot:TRINITY_DN477_c0_g1_i1.p1 TRINITY_DN477_c0_g1~~TRINITY_DN477_c0_g1_i1.p1  ORF type:complete len:1365 (+),score=300.33 TRINITY_DN477_c0_g1_i1:42-4136(+)